MKLKIVLTIFIIATILSNNLFACSTVMLLNKNSYLIGHNLDDQKKCPGMFYVNKRGLTKRNISFNEFFTGNKTSELDLKWTAKYGSVTYSLSGTEFIDGGMNEKGLYVGEMTNISQNHQYPLYENAPKMYVSQWVMYLLDNFSTVDEVIDSLGKINIEGPNPWHFYIADKEKNHCVIEFMNGKALVRKNNDLPVKTLCNSDYCTDFETLKQYKDYGGDKEIYLSDKSKDNRFAHTTKMLNEYKVKSNKKNINFVFEILNQNDYTGLEWANTQAKWSIVFDIKNMEVYYRTDRDRNIKNFSFESFDFSCNTPIQMIDINASYESKVDSKFTIYNDEIIKNQIRKLYNCIEGLKDDKELKEKLIERISDYHKSIECNK